jgi:hypothetical protein
MLDAGYWMKRGVAPLSLSSIQYPGSHPEIVGWLDDQPTLIDGEPL